MERALVLDRLRAHKADLAKLGVGSLYLFGSVARDEAVADSDVDLLIEPTNERFSLFDLIGVTDRCTEILGVPADIHDYRGLPRVPTFHSRIAADIVHVF